ncbi:hypothetical protein HG537_0B06470 [Torulaspora globosa]|uniref:DUF3835 domain-containing protein n=1 Tax=Torulaspora globosa TaxID=48254 RepID=A0A7H9HPU3_9SACH|nr:hypothetical protein HG537_0B06470 [Torulaspora sp. CBS 2947]
MDSLTKSVEQTLKNLQEKKRFLLQQRDRYIHIRQRILQYDDVDEVGQSKEGTLEVFDDVIISPERMFVSVGYDYYVEKSQDELLTYVDEKRKLIEQAIEQFDSKIKDGEKAIQSFEMLLKSEQTPTPFEDADGERDEEFPPMEIREELDENWNVISSSVTPAVASLNQEKKIQDPDEATEVNDFERNIKGRLVENKSQEKEEPEKRLSAPINGAFSTENMYTFADLVRQLDEQDAVEDEIDSSEIQYDFESFDSKYVVEHLTEESETQGEDQVQTDSTEGSTDEEEDDDDENRYMIAPTMEAHSAFMDQLKKLREKKSDQKIVEKAKAPVKSILKCSSDNKKKTKKSVGFASKLDIHEVENLKQENRRNRHNLSSSFMQQLEHENDEVSTYNEFDSDLFAQLIGARGPDEIHDKYKSEENVEKDSSTASPNKNRIKVSRFKQERKFRNNEHEKESKISSSNSISKYQTNRPIDENSRTSMDIVSESVDISVPTDTSRISERDTDQSVVVDLIIENDPDEFATMNSKDGEEASQPAIQELIVEKETDELATADLIVERDSNNIATAIRSTDVNEYDSAIRRGISETSSDLRPHVDKTSPLSKTMRSLQRSVRPKGASQNMAYDFSDSSEDLSDISDSDKHLSESESLRVSENFPAEVLNGGHRTANTISLPKVDYNALGDNLDDMAKAYSLGIYDDDLDEDPGTLLEKIDDFKHYNEQVERLKNDIEAFKIANPMQEFDHDQQTIAEDGPLLNEVKENDIPESYNEVNFDDDLALEPARLRESIAIEYSRLRQVISANSNNLNGVTKDQHDESKQIEPIDQNGEPIKLSRFKSQRLQIGK